MNRKLKAQIFYVYGTQQDFADAIGDYPPNVSLVIRGRRPLSEEQKHKWAEALGCSVDDIFDEEDDSE